VSAPQILAAAAVATALVGLVAFRRCITHPSGGLVAVAFALSVIALASAVGYAVTGSVTP
jgi:hypothetical protein